MALEIADRVKETTTTTSTGTYTLAGAVDGFQSFAAVGDGNTTYYACTDGTDYEVGVGSYTASGTTLSRVTILESSNSDAAVNWGAGTKEIFVTVPAEKYLVRDASGNVSLTGNLTISGTVDGRDVSADGSKLDGIESGATADQTAAQIRAKVEAASDSNVFTDADHSKLNGIEANAKDDQTITAGSGLTGGGTGDVTLSHADTSSQASVNGSGRTYIQDITLDTYGHVTGLATATETVVNTDTVPNNATITISAGNALTGGGNFTTDQASNETITINHEDTSSQASVNNSGRTYIQDITLDGYGHVTGISSATETVTDTNTNQLTTFQVEDGDGTEVTISHGKEWKFVEAGGININWTDTDPGSDTDPYDLSFNISSSITAGSGLTGGGQLNASRTISHADTSSQASVNNSGRTYIQDITLDGFGHVTGISSATETVTNTNTTYDLSVPSSTTNIRLAGSDSTNDDVQITGSGATTVTRISATQLQISSTDTNTDTNTTYSLKAQQTGGNNTNPNLWLDASTGTDDYVQLVGGGATTITRNSDGQITISSTDTNTDTNTNQLTTFQVEDGDGTEVTISHGKEWKFVEGGGVNIDWTDTDPGSDADPYDLTFTINTGVTAGSGLTGGGTLNATRTISHADTSSQASVNNSGRTYIQDITLDGFGHVTGITSATETVTNTDTNTNQLTTFQLEDGDGTEVTISHGKEVKFVEGGNIDINWTDTSNGTDGDPYDLTFAVSSNPSFTDVYVDDQILSTGDTDTYMQFHAADQWRVVTGGTERLEVNNTVTTIQNELTARNATFDAGTSTTVNVKCDDAGLALLRVNGDGQGTGAVEVGQSDTYGGGMYYNGDGTPAFASGEVADAISFYRLSAGTRTEVFYYGHSSSTVYFNGSIVIPNMYVNDNVYHNGDTNTYYGFHAADQWRVVVGGTERLEVKNSSPHVLVTGDLNSTSDARLKENVEPIANALSDITQLEGVSFDWKDTGTRGHGFIAQQVEPILPDVVNTDDETGIKSINYVGMIGHLVEAIKELKAEINELKR